MDQPSPGLRADIAAAYATHASGRPLESLVVNAWRGRLLMRDVALALGRWRARRA